MREKIVDEFLAEIAENTTYAKEFFEFYLKGGISDESLEILKQVAKERLMNEGVIDLKAFRGFLDDVKPHTNDHLDDSPTMKDWVSLEGSFERFIASLKSNTNKCDK